MSTSATPEPRASGSTDGDRRPGAQDGLTLGDVVHFLVRRWWLILLPGLLAALGVWLYAGAQPPMYRAMASLLVSPEPMQLKSLVPASLTPEAYQRLLESPVVIGETRKRLREQGVLDGHRLQVGKNLTSQILIAPSPRRGETAQASLVQLVAVCPTPELARAAANTWADVFREQAEKMSRQGVLEPLQRLEERYPEVDERLSQLEQRRVQQQDASGRERLDLNSRWRARLDAYRAQTGRLETEYQAESRRLSNETTAEARLVTRRAHLEARQAALTQLETRLAQLKSETETLKQRLEATRKQLAATPEYVESRRSMNDDTVWDLVVRESEAPATDDRPKERSRDRSPDSARDSSRNSQESGRRGTDWQRMQLIEQEPNPVYTELSMRVARLEVDLSAALAPREALEEQRAELVTEVNRLEAEMQEARTKVDAVTRERESGLAILLYRRSEGLEALSEAWLEERTAQERQAELDNEQVEREIDRLQKEAEMILPAYLDGRLLSAQLAAPAVSIGIRASEPAGQVRQSPLFKAILALMAGCLFGLLIALGLELRRWSRA